MHNELNPQDGLEPRTPRRTDDRLTDREVPLDTGRIPAVVHAWLDGTVTDAEMRASEAAPQMEFWKRLNTDVERYRAMRTPADFQERIMTALPQAAPGMESWYSRPITITPATAIAGGAALVALGALLAFFAR